MIFLPCGPLKTISKTPNNMKKPHPKPTAHKLKFSIQVSRSSLCPEKKLKSFDSGEVQ